MTIEAPVRIPREKLSATNDMIYLQRPVPDSQHRLEVWYASDSGTGESRASATIGVRFLDLVEWWHADTDGLSLDRESYEHPAYRRIVEELGADAIPYMLADLRDRNGHWFDALRKLSGDTTVDSAANGSMRRARDLWLRWGRAKKLV